jgi:hypothetical protein
MTPAGAGRVKVSGEWKPVNTVSVKIDGEWRGIQAAWVKRNDEWRPLSSIGAAATINTTFNTTNFG